MLLVSPDALCAASEYLNTLLKARDASLSDRLVNVSRQLPMAEQGEIETRPSPFRHFLLILHTSIS